MTRADILAEFMLKFMAALSQANKELDKYNQHIEVHHQVESLHTVLIGDDRP